MRPPVLNPLFADAASLPGVGPALAKALARIDLTRVRDVALHLPLGWARWKRVARLGDAAEGERIIVALTVLAHQESAGRGPLRIRANDADGAPVTLAFFGGAGGYAAAKLPVGSRRVVAGKLERHEDRWQIVHPDRIAEDEAGTPPLEPVYALTAGVTNRRMAAAVAAALKRAPVLDEWVEPSMLARHGWPGWRAALETVHGVPDAAAARDRLAYDELLANQLAWALVRASRRRRRGRALQGDGQLTEALVAGLPWPLTGAQRRAGAEIAGDMAQRHAMLRLLQGDVGSGKTLVALIAMLTAVEAGAQAALLAPTDLLARQHRAVLEKMLGDLPVRLGFLSGREKGRAREATLAALAAGEIDILVGTHAIFQQGVAYRDLGLAVVDEQHKFGVAQRLMLAEKAEVPPHLLVMTATPIPRTLALTAFGEMDVSRLDERPPGRTPVVTRVMAMDRLEELLEGLGRHLAAGRQAYWVCPLVGDGDEDEAAATARAATLRARFGETVALVHGRLPGPEKDAAMARFAAGEAGVLVATTVIEVGVDVPNASLMVVEAAERFGLAQLHQLRGRVGRGAAQSSCVLLRGLTLTATAKARLKMMRETDDGFAIAEADLRLRGAGEMLGTRQSGEASFALADEEQVARLVGAARDDARLLLERDGGLEGVRGEAARVLLYLFEQDAAVSLLRSG
ncbi:ATP-dependent DNA helicase RecG [Sandaracinobacteroides saxicola]|uniref:ATP-dependent DNA helicase RecG n=1 Tax=Sandaracinobacteroides saxicola TaxID=2759707 RepID=A0A7G5IEA6_9SPHN|nr:ATP-dependent DNA helicase RecG [Sandaracinobacteroides saxicola]QMW21698.1 ATP-dependent DNA helicase RecG [Sandaracinobacteroides saxicola]